MGRVELWALSARHFVYLLVLLTLARPNTSTDADPDDVLICMCVQRSNLAILLCAKINSFNLHLE